MPFSPVALVLVFVGGGVGSLLRLILGAAVTERFGAGFPWGTFLINVLGSAVMGVAVVVINRRFEGEAADMARLALMTGVLGGFTTFSAFSLDAVLLWQREAHWAAALYVGGSVLMSLAALAVAMAATKAALG